MFNNKKILIVFAIVSLIIVALFVWFFLGENKPGFVEKIGEMVGKDKVEQAEEQRPRVFIKIPEKFSDADGDGISDEQEKELGISETEFDTDHDGLSDKMEIESLGTDPLKADTDGDGYSDAVELLNGYNPLGE